MLIRSKKKVTKKTTKKVTKKVAKKATKKVVKVAAKKDKKVVKKSTDSKTSSHKDEETTKKFSKSKKKSAQTIRIRLKTFDHKLIDRSINKLPKKCKEIFKLSKTEGLTNHEIATLLNISVKTVEAQITIAFKKINLSGETVF